MKKFLTLTLMTLLMVSLTGCSSFGRKLKAFLGGQPVKQVSKQPKKSSPGYGTAYSKNKNVNLSEEKRNYRMTRDQFENEARVRSRQGSLWAMEGQESYLFAQNMMRLKGDILDVVIEGSPRKQLETKVQVINKLLERLKRAKKRKARLAQNTVKKPSSPTANSREPASRNEDDKAELFDVETVPVRIVEKLRNGNYRVRGGQTFMIDKREYKVIVTGEVRGSDIDGSSVKASQMLDSKFDIVSPRREGTM